jgi:LysM repeat protein
MIDREYVVKAGDSLGNLADDIYGNVGNFREIADRNGIDIFEILPAGRKLDIPTKDEAKAAIAKVTEQVARLADQIDKLDLSKIKQPETGNPFQLISWIL